MKRLYSLVLIVLIAKLASAGSAGGSEAGRSILASEEVATFANRVQKYLAARGVNVAIVSRMGRDPKVLPPRRPVHACQLLVFSQITEADGSTGRGYRVYNLYQLDGDQTRRHLVQDSPADFFAGAHRLDAGIIIPHARLQKKLLSVIASPTYSALHNADYSEPANPNTRRFQNRTEHTLDVVTASLYGTGDPRQIKADIAAHFKPQEVELGGVKRFLAPVAAQALTTSDHGPKVATATFGSIARFMAENGLPLRTYRINPDRLIRF